MKRLFIEVAHESEGDRKSVEAFCALMRGCKEDGFFTDVVHDALAHQEELLEKIKDSDEIYISTAFIPQFLGSNFGSPMLMNNMMHYATEAGITGKKLFIARSPAGLMWDELDKNLLLKCFEKNEIYAINDEYDDFEKLEPKQIVIDYM